jgi:hypothetical protein
MNLSFYLKKLKTTDLSRFTETAKRISVKVHRPWRMVLMDILLCTVKYGSGHVDYESFEMYNKNAKERAEILTVGKNNKIFKQFNDTRYIPYFEDKAVFNKKFNKFIKRDWILVDEGKRYGNIAGSALTEDDQVIGQGREALRKFLEGKDYIMVKPLDLSCGHGIEKLKVSDWEPDELYDYLVKNGKPLAEEVVKQHHVMNQLSSYSVNTIRVITILKDGKARIVSGGIRMGKPGSVVDNFNAGGISTIYDFKTGVIISDGYDKERTVYETVPETGVKLKGFQIPMWDEVCEMINEAANLVPQVGYVGWDVCVSEDHGPLLIEGNSYPSQDLSQEPSLNAGTYTAILEALK